MLTSAQNLFLVLLCCSIFFNLFGFYAVLSFKKNHPVLKTPDTKFPQANHLNSIAILIPFHGREETTRRNLEAFCKQTLPPSEIRCGVDNPNDSAVPVIKQIQKDFPSVNITLNICSSSEYPNKKIQNLSSLAKGAEQDLVIAVDQDVFVPPDYLEDMAAHLCNPKTGMVTCLYRVSDSGHIGGILERLAVHSDFFPSVLISEKLEKGLGFAFGATLGFKKESLKKIGGFESAGNYLADDHELGRKIKELKYNVALSGVIVEHNPGTETFKEYWKRGIRAARTHRICRPGGYFLSLFSQGLPWGIMGLCFSFSWLFIAVFTLWGITRLMTSAAGSHILRGKKRDTAYFLMLPFHECLKFVFWILAFTGNKVIWSGKSYRVFTNGTFKEIF